jgi:hypothetical protein
MTPIVRNIQNNDAYKYLGGNRYKNIRTQKEGEVSEETAQKIFKVNIELTAMVNENPLVEDLIEALNLKIDK